MVLYLTQWRCFGTYVYLHTKDKLSPLYPIVECLINAIHYDQSVDKFLPFLFSDEEVLTNRYVYCWSWWRQKQSDDTYIYHVWTDPKVSGLDPCEGTYDEATIKLHVRRTLDHFRKIHPERSADVEEVIAKYQL